MYALDYRASGFAGFGATTVLAPASARGPIRLAEIKAALGMPAAANPTIKGLLYNAQSSVALMTEAGVAAGERLYMQAVAQAAALQSPIPLPRALTVPAATETPATKEAAGAITSVLDAITKAFTASTTPTRPATPELLPTGAAPWSVPHPIRGAWEALDRPIGPLPLWQWVALGGAGVVAIGVAAKVAKLAVVGGALAAATYGFASYQRWRSAPGASA